MGDVGTAVVVPLVPTPKTQNAMPGLESCVSGFGCASWEEKENLMRNDVERPKKW